MISNNEDTTPPEISDFSFTPTAIDITSDSQNVTVTVRVRDARAGVRSVDVRFLPTSSGAFYSVYMDSSNRISGDDKDGVYKGVAIFPQNFPPAMYSVSVLATDMLFNYEYLLASELAERGYPSQLQINTSTPTVFVYISGRVLTTNGRGVSRAVVTLTESNGSVRYANTNPFGYYRFDPVKVGATYTFSVKHKRYIFASQVLSVNGGNNSLNFVANEHQYFQ